MKKEILITLCCASLILVTPLTGVAQESTVSSNLPEQPNDVKGLVAQIRTVVDEILQRYGHIPMVSSLCNMILGLLGLIGDTIICIFSIMLFIPLITVGTMLYILYRTVYRFVYSKVLWELQYLFNSYAYLFLMTAVEYCAHISYMIPFKSLYTMLETKDNINTFDGCPCLQD